jgi:glycosyltransferase involved in cell wall biosynthesis
MIKISIIIPTKDRPQFLNSALKPFRNFLSDIEIIVIDDGSQSDNAALNKQACNILSNCYYQCIQKSRGAARARNLGLSLSRGKWIWFVDDDDIVPIKAIEKVLHIINQEKSHDEVLLLPMTQVSDTFIVNKVYPTQERNNFNSYRHKGHEVNTSCAVFLQKILIESEGWDDSLVAGQDTDLFLRISRIAHLTCLETDPVVVNIGHAKRTTRNVVKQQIGKLQFLKKHWSILTSRRKLYYLGTFLLCIPCFYGLKLKMHRVIKQLSNGGH